MQNGKGDSRRPLKVDTKKFEQNWTLAFGEKKESLKKNKSKKTKKAKNV
jgi:hypothetical protein